MNLPTKPLRVVHLCPLDEGITRHLGNYMVYQRDQGYDVSAICHPGRWLTHDTTILDGIFVKVEHFEPRITPAADLRTLARLLHYFRKEEFDIVHTHSVKPGLLGRLAAKAAGTPVIVHTLHGSHFHDTVSPLARWIFTAIEKLGATCCDSILCQSWQDVESAIRRRVCQPDKIHYLSNGIDLVHFDPGRVSSEKIMALRASLGIAPQQMVIGFIGRLVRQKGIAEFVEAISILKSRGVRAAYVFIGTPQQGRKSSVSLGRLLREKGVHEDVMLLGWRNDVPQLLSLMDIVVLPSYREGISRTLMEAAAMAKPVVTTRVGGNLEVVEDGKTGVLVPVRDAEALAEGIHSLLRDLELARRMGRLARQRALNHFDERLFFWKTDAEYRRLLKNRLAVDSKLSLKPIPISEELLGANPRLVL